MQRAGQPVHPRRRGAGRIAGTLASGRLRCDGSRQHAPPHRGRRERRARLLARPPSSALARCGTRTLPPVCLGQRPHACADRYRDHRRGPGLRPGAVRTAATRIVRTLRVHRRWRRPGAGGRRRHASAGTAAQPVAAGARKRTRPRAGGHTAAAARRARCALRRCGGSARPGRHRDRRRHAMEAVGADRAHGDAVPVPRRHLPRDVGRTDAARRCDRHLVAAPAARSLRRLLHLSRRSPCAGRRHGPQPRHRSVFGQPGGRLHAQLHHQPGRFGDKTSRLGRRIAPGSAVRADGHGDLRTARARLLARRSERVRIAARQVSGLHRGRFARHAPPARLAPGRDDRRAPAAGVRYRQRARTRLLHAADSRCGARQ
jgi:hypothetical protein